MALARELLEGLPPADAWRVAKSGTSFDVGMLTRVRMERCVDVDTQKRLVRFLASSRALVEALGADATLGAEQSMSGLAPEAPVTRLLLLDDDEAVRRSWERLASASAIELRAVACVEQARQALASEPFDLVVCDWNLGSHETSEALVRELAARGQPVVVVTGRLEEARRALGFLAPALDKPVRLPELLAAWRDGQLG